MNPKLEAKWEHCPYILPKLSVLNHLAQKQTNTNLWQLHLHVGKNMQEPDHSVPQPAVSETLLVANARSLEATTQKALNKHKFKKMLARHHYFASRWPVCTLSRSWRPAWPLPALWRSSSALLHPWHPSQSSTSRNHWWIPNGRRGKWFSTPDERKWDVFRLGLSWYHTWSLRR